MKHKTWFRLVIKAIGILLVGLSLPSIVGSLGQIPYFFSVQSTTGMALTMSDWIWPQVFYWLGSALQLALGLYLFLGGTWIVNKCIPSNRPYCPECGYDLSHNQLSSNCPECGVILPKAESP